MSIVTAIKGDIVKAALKKVAGDNDTKTTALGTIAAGLLASQIDWGKLFQKDPTQIGLLVGTVVTLLFGYFTNKKDKGNGGGDKQAQSK